MKKDEIIEQYGEEEYERRKEQSRLGSREWLKNHRSQDRENSRNWGLKNPESVRNLEGNITILTEDKIRRQ
jgi:hypothetical protein